MQPNFRADQRYPALDGLRGVAILLVMIGHFTRLEVEGILGLPFEFLREIGWTGVDLFFVLSGFLITGILFRTKDSPRYLKNFFARRALRIIPLYYLLLLLYTVIFPLVFPADNPYIPRPWITEPAWYWSFLSNIYIFNLGKFPDEVMSVSWSLAMEEQFYLVWPLAVLFCKKNRFVVCCVTIIISAIATRALLYLNGANFIQSFVYPFARMDSLAIGALAVYVWRHDHALAWYRAKKKIITVTTFTILGTCYLWDAISLYTGSASPQYRVTSILLFTAISASYAVILLEVLLNPTTKGAKLLTANFLKVAGLFSFAMYLTNNTISHTLMVFGFSPGEIAGGGILGQLIFYLVCYPLTFGVGWACYHGIEKHFLKLKPKFI